MHEIKLLLTNLDHTSFTSSENKIANNTKYRKAICIFLRSVELLLSFTSTDLLQIVTIREEKWLIWTSAVVDLSRIRLEQQFLSV